MYCNRHHVEYALIGGVCHHCEAEEAAKESLKIQREQLRQEQASSADAQQRHEELFERLAEHDREQERKREDELQEENYYGPDNPGDYECPHCKYISLMRDASRCPLCHGEITGSHWYVIRAREKADAETQRALEAARAAEWVRTAPEREAAARAAFESARFFRNIKGAVGLIVGAIVGGVAGFIVTIIPVILLSLFLSNDALNQLILVVVVLGAIIGAMQGWMVGRDW